MYKRFPLAHILVMGHKKLFKARFTRARPLRIVGEYLSREVNYHNESNGPFHIAARISPGEGAEQRRAFDGTHVSTIACPSRFLCRNVAGVSDSDGIHAEILTEILLKLYHTS